MCFFQLPKRKRKKPNSMKDLFLLDKELTFLNFGSFGACPKEIFEVYQQFQIELEKDPVHFITEKGIQLLKESRRALAAYIHCEAADLIFTPNPTYAMNLVVNQMDLGENDEVLTSNLEYGAMDKMWTYHAKLKGFKYVQSTIDIPIEDEQTFLKQFWSAFTPQTKVIFISQITSATGLIFPIKAIVKEAKKRNLITIIDGAHVPGHIDLDLQSLDPDYYTGACHKWMMAPKGCSFLYVKKQWQSDLNPLIISWGWDDPYLGNDCYFDFHQMNGTRDYSAYLTIPAAISFMEKHQWKNNSKECHLLGLQNYQRFCDLFNSPMIAPLNEHFFGQLFSIPIHSKDPIALKELLYSKYKIQIPVIVQNERTYLRYSVQAFNTQKDLDILFEALSAIKLNRSDLLN
jgi:isopenicillin-N epimerase